MKFGDKLIQLRKKNGLSQEELAEKLGVSRQSVSKWESNNTYPETDKIVQICNIFDCSMDDLINDKVDLDQTYRKNKNALNEGMDSFLEFTTKTVKMFSNMSFSEGFKCILKLVLYTLVLLLVGQIITKSLATIIANIFSFLTPHAISNIREGLKAILYGVWFIGTFVVIIHTFKIQYLDKYHHEETQEVKEDNQNKKENKNSNSKEEVVEVKSSENSYSFIKGLSKFFILCIKFVVVLFLLGVVATTVSFTIGTVISLSLIAINKIFVGSSLALIGGTTISILLLSIGIHFLFDKKINFPVHIIIFLVSLLLCGVGVGVSVLSMKDFQIIDEPITTDLEEKTITTDYIDDLVIINASGRSDQYKYVIDNNIGENQIEIHKMVYSKTETISSYINQNDRMNLLHVYSDFNGNVRNLFHTFVEDLKKSQIRSNYGTTFDSGEVLIIKANEETIQKLLENTKKLYLISIEDNGEEKIVTIHDDKVYFPYGIHGYYDARYDQLFLEDEEDYNCIRSISITDWGEKIIFSCKYNEEDYD